VRIWTLCVSVTLLQTEVLICVRLTVFNEVLNDVFAASLDSAMQQSAAVFVLQQEVHALLVELHQLHDNAGEHRAVKQQRR